MKIKTSEATPNQINHLVAVCEGISLNEGNTLQNECDVYSPSTDWEQGGPIIERYCINLFRLDPKTEEDDRFWVAHIDGIYCQYGVSALIAAMRCFVASKLGDEVDIPDEVLEN